MVKFYSPQFSRDYQLSCIILIRIKMGVIKSETRHFEADLVLPHPFIFNLNVHIRMPKLVIRRDKEGWYCEIGTIFYRIIKSIIVFYLAFLWSWWNWKNLTEDMIYPLKRSLNVLNINAEQLHYITPSWTLWGILKPLTKTRVNSTWFGNITIGSIYPQTIIKQKRNKKVMSYNGIIKFTYKENIDNTAKECSFITQHIVKALHENEWKNKQKTGKFEEMKACSISLIK